jgi:hypothetical protein
MRNAIANGKVSDLVIHKNVSEKERKEQEEKFVVR